jgi:Tol biopolymer transport system component
MIGQPPRPKPRSEVSHGRQACAALAPALQAKDGRCFGLVLEPRFLITQLTIGEASADPAAPDGFIVYSAFPQNASGADQAPDLWLTTTRSNTDRRLTTTPGSELTPAWAHDGRRVAFSRGSINAIDVYTGNQTVLIDGGSFLHPAWSPDDSQLVFDGQLASDPPGIYVHLYRKSLSGGPIQQLTFSATSDIDASWSPTGDLIAFTHTAPNVSEIWLVNADGSNPHPIPTGLRSLTAPDWSPDGQWLAFVGSANNFTVPEVYKMRSDGTQLTQVTFNSTNSMDEPSWSPDGSLILFEQFVQHGTNDQRGKELMVVSANGGPSDLLRPGVRHLLGQLWPDWQPINP